MDTRLGRSFLLLACFTLSHRAPSAESPSEMANVLAGTTNNYDISTGGNMPLMARPFGFNHWSVATTMRDGRLDFSPASSDFYGILCTHQPSWWISDYGYFLILPKVETPITSFITLPGASFFRPDQTVYRPYYFRTSLVNSPPVAACGYVVTEMTPTDHAAALRFRFVSEGKKQIIFRNSRDLVLLSKPDEVSRIAFTTNVNSGGVPANFRMFVVIDAKPLPVSVMLDTSLSRDAVLSFDVAGSNNATTTTVVEVRVATSFISEAQAWLNLHPDVMDAGFRLLRQTPDEEEEEEEDDDEERSPEDVISLEDFVHSLPLMGGSNQGSNERGSRGGGGGVKMSVEDVKLMFEGVTRWTSSDDHEELLDAVCGDKHHPHSPGEVETPDAEQPEPAKWGCQPGNRLKEKISSSMEAAQNIEALDSRATGGHECKALRT
ncbi:hypothetical protein FOZ63_034009, partial [Perkinsus olseni]